MAVQEAILKDLQLLSAPMLQQVADYVHSLSLRAAGERQAAFEASFGSMPQEEADEFDSVIGKGCKQVEP